MTLTVVRAYTSVTERVCEGHLSNRRVTTYVRVMYSELCRQQNREMKLYVESA